MVSVVIPTHNRVDLLPRAIESVLNQTYKDIELIVVSDGSTDGTNEFMAKYANDSRIKYINYKPAKGGNYARNTGIKAAKGEYVAFLDDDDEWLPRKLEKQLEIMDANSEIGLVYTGTHSIYVNDNLVYDSCPIHQGDMSKQILYRNYIGSTTTVILRKKIFEKAGLFDEELPAIQDYDLWIRVCQITKIGVVPPPMVNYYNYNNTGQISSSYKKYVFAYELVNNKYKHLFAKLSTNEMKKRIAAQKASFGMRAFRVGDKKVARDFFCQSLRICTNMKVILYYLSTFFDYKLLLKVRSMK